MFEASKKEVSEAQQLINDLFARRASQMVAKFNITSVVLWCKDMASKSRKKDNEAFAAKCDQIVSDMTMTYTVYNDMEKELRIALQRTADLEIQVLRYKTIAEQQLTVIGNMEKELGY